MELSLVSSLKYFYINCFVQSRASFAADEADFVTIHTFESDEFSGEVVSMEALLGAFADSAGKQTEAAAGLAGGACVWTLEF